MPCSSGQYRGVSLAEIAFGHPEDGFACGLAFRRIGSGAEIGILPLAVSPSGLPCSLAVRPSGLADAAVLGEFPGELFAHAEGLADAARLCTSSCWTT